MNQQIESNDEFKEIKSILEKELSKVSSSDRDKLVKYAFKIQEDDWFSSRVIAVRTANDGFTAILQEISFFIPETEDNIIKTLNLPKDYLYGFNSSYEVRKLLENNADFIVEGWKCVVKRDVLDKLKQQINEIRRENLSKLNKKYKGNKELRIKSITEKYKLELDTDLDKEFSIVFEKSKDGKYLDAKVETKKIVKKNVAKDFIDSGVYKNFCIAIGTINVGCTIYELQKNIRAGKFHESALSSIQAASEITAVISNFVKSDIAANRINAVSSALECALNGYTAGLNFYEQDYDAGIIYTASAISNIASFVLFISGAATTGPVGAGIMVGLLVVNYILSRLAVYLDDDDFQEWLKYCFWGNQYGTNIPEGFRRDWSVKPFKEWTNNLNMQLEAYKNVINDFKVQLYSYGSMEDSYPLCLLDITVYPKTYFDFSVMRISLKINGKTCLDKNVYDRENVVYDRNNNGNIFKVSFGLIDIDKEDVNECGLKSFNNKEGKKGDWYDKTFYNNRVENFISSIDKNETETFEYEAEIELNIEIDLYNDNKIVLTHKDPIKKKMILRKFKVPTTIFEDHFNDAIYNPLKLKNSSDANEFRKKYTKRNCNKCNRMDVCRVHGMKKTFFSKGIVNCYRLFNKDDDKDYNSMSREDKDWIRKRLADLSYYNTYEMGLNPNIDYIL